MDLPTGVQATYAVNAAKDSIAICLDFFAVDQFHGF